MVAASMATMSANRFIAKNMAREAPNMAMYPLAMTPVATARRKRSTALIAIASPAFGRPGYAVAIRPSMSRRH